MEMRTASSDGSNNSVFELGFPGRARDWSWERDCPAPQFAFVVVEQYAAEAWHRAAMRGHVLERPVIERTRLPSLTVLIDSSIVNWSPSPEEEHRRRSPCRAARHPASTSRSLHGSATPRRGGAQSPPPQSRQCAPATGSAPAAARGAGPGVRARPPEGRNRSRPPRRRARPRLRAPLTAREISASAAGRVPPGAGGAFQTWPHRPQRTVRPRAPIALSGTRNRAEQWGQARIIRIRPAGASRFIGPGRLDRQGKRKVCVHRPPVRISTR